MNVGREADDALAVVALDQSGHGPEFQSRDVASDAVSGRPFCITGRLADLLDALHPVLRELHLNLEGVAGVRDRASSSAA